MEILLIEPYYTGSHQQWADGYKAHSQHEVKLLTLSGHYWKWRMHGGAITLARQFLAESFRPDLVLVSDMLDLTTFQALTRELTADIPTALYFHENQLTYPWSKTDRDVVAGRNNHYGFINYSSAMTADRVFFNSSFHMEEFYKELYPFLKGFPDHNELGTIEQLQQKSEVLHLGMDLAKFDKVNSMHTHPGPPVILWNHRWEYDKNPTDFFKALSIIQQKGIDFHLIVLGENFTQQPVEFEKAKKEFADRILHFGYAEDFNTYASLLSIADVIPVTSNQDFFGGSVVEAMYNNVHPLLPNRLAFPGHVPAEHVSGILYEDLDGLVDKLSQFLINYPSGTLCTKDWVSKYDWDTMARIYDHRLEDMK